MIKFAIGDKVKQVVVGYQWEATIVGEWDYGYIVKVDDKYLPEFTSWGQGLTHYPFYSGVYR